MSDATDPRISVVMPTRNAARFLDAALRSIRRQEIAVHEVLMVDNASTDDTRDIAGHHCRDGLPVRLLAGPGAGPGASRNRGIAAAEGELIAFLDADDLWPPGKLRRQAARLRSAPAVDMVSGYVCYFDTADDDGLAPAPGTRTERIFHVHVGACLYRRDVFARLGGAFDESLLYSEDVDLMLRLREAGIPFTILRSVELYYRQHPASMMAQKNPRQDADFRRATLLSLRRRRAAGTLAETLPDFSSFLEPAP